MAVNNLNFPQEKGVNIKTKVPSHTVVVMMPISCDSLELTNFTPKSLLKKRLSVLIAVWLFSSSKKETLRREKKLVAINRDNYGEYTSSHKSQDTIVSKVNEN